MGYRQNDTKPREYNYKFSVQEWYDFKDKLLEMQANNKLSERDSKILTEIIINQKTTAELAYLARTDESYDWLQSNQNKPISERRIHQILTQNFPEFHIQTSHKQDNPRKNARREQTKLRQQLITEDSFCKICGSKENLELHHMIPLAIGGDNDNRNIIILCCNCHKTITYYDNSIISKIKRVVKKTGEINFLDNEDE